MRYHASSVITHQRPGPAANPNRHIGREVALLPNGARIDYQRYRFVVKDSGLPSSWAMQEDIDARAGFALDYPRDAGGGQPCFRVGDVIWIALVGRYLRVRVARVYTFCGYNACAIHFVDHDHFELDDVMDAQLSKLACIRPVGLLPPEGGADGVVKHTCLGCDGAFYAKQLSEASGLCAGCEKKGESV